MNRRAVAIVGCLVALAGCGSEADEARPLHLPAGAVYRSPAGNFTCVVPVLLEDHAHEAERTRGDDSVTVTFTDEFGTLLQIESGKIAAADRPRLFGPDRRAALDAFFDRVLLPDQIAATFPGAQVVHRAFIDPSLKYAPAGDSLFAVVRLPDGIRRGYLLFPKGDYLYVVTDQEWPSLVRDVPMPTDDRLFRLQSDLRQAAASMTFAE